MDMNLYIAAFWRPTRDERIAMVSRYDEEPGAFTWPWERPAAIVRALSATYGRLRTRRRVNFISGEFALTPREAEVLRGAGVFRSGHRQRACASAARRFQITYPASCAS